MISANTPQHGGAMFTFQRPAGEAIYEQRSASDRLLADLGFTLHDLSRFTGLISAVCGVSATAYGATPGGIR
jgi:hypothetical protein